jgi:CubicO group peptidase (beta-lactamase class C family)
MRYCIQSSGPAPRARAASGYRSGAIVRRTLISGILASAVPVAGLAAQADSIPVARIDAVFARYDHTASPGCAVGIYRAGVVQFARGYGMADLEQGTVIGPGTVFYIASTSKQFTAASIALLVDDGRLALADPVRRYVPELGAYADSITVGHLVHHTSGLRDYLGLWGLSGRSFADEIPGAVALDLIARQEAADFAPGARWSYSNSGYLLLALIVERVAGQSLREFARQRMFEPLGMTSTHFHDDNAMLVPRRARGYQVDPKGGWRAVPTSFALVGDGGLLTTVLDLARWDANFYENRLGSGGPALIATLTTPGRLGSGRPLTYAFGLTVGSWRGLRTVRHGGSFIGFRAELLRFPDERLSVAVLCNDYGADASGLAEQVAEVLLGDRLRASPEQADVGVEGIAVASSVLDRYAGRYEIGPGAVAEVARTETGLTLRAFGSEPVPLVPRSDSTFASRVFPGLIQFRRFEDGSPALLMPGPMSEPAPRLPASVTYSAGELAAFAGRYTSRELDTWYTVAVEGDRLRYRARWGRWVTLAPLRRDVFGGAGIRLAFDRGRRGEVSGFRLSAARTLNVTFAREAGRP